MNNSLYLNKEIYDEKCIYAAIQAYSQLSSINCVSNEKGWVCFFYQCQYDVELTKMEFENYLIGIMNRRLMNADM